MALFETGLFCCHLRDMLIPSSVLQKGVNAVNVNVLASPRLDKKWGEAGVWSSKPGTL
jgi:hypothetical protein